MTIAEWHRGQTWFNAAELASDRQDYREHADRDDADPWEGIALEDGRGIDDGNASGRPQ